MSVISRVMTFGDAGPSTGDRTTLAYHHEARQRRIYSGERLPNGKRYEWPTRVDVPEWLTPGVNIAVRGYPGQPNKVLAVDGMLTIVEGGKYVWAIDTSIVVGSWEVAP